MGVVSIGILTTVVDSGVGLEEDSVDHHGLEVEVEYVSDFNV